MAFAESASSAALPEIACIYIAEGYWQYPRLQQLQVAGLLEGQQVAEQWLLLAGLFCLQQDVHHRRFAGVGVTALTSWG